MICKDSHSVTKCINVFISNSCEMPRLCFSRTHPRPPPRNGVTALTLGGQDDTGLEKKLRLVNHWKGSIVLQLTVAKREHGERTKRRPERRETNLNASVPGRNSRRCGTSWDV